MADISSSDVTILKSWTEADLNGKLMSCRQVSMVLGGQGTTTNKIPAAALSLQKIEQSSNFVKSDNASIYPAVPSADGANLLLVNLAQVTDANRDDPADITATIIGVVKGY